jgi:SAM-dependent methyltransferase
MINALPAAPAVSPDLPGSELVRQFSEAYKRRDYHRAFDIACAEIAKYPVLEYAAKRLALSAQEIEIREFNPLHKRAISYAFHALTIEHRHFMTAWLALMAFDPLHAPLMDLMDAENDTDFSRRVNWNALSPSLKDDFFLMGLRRLILADIPFETLLTRLRRWVTQTHIQKPFLTADDLPFLSALSEYFHEHEYAAFEAPDETRLIKDLEERNDDISLCLLGCYRVLHGYPAAQARAQQKNLPAAVSDLLDFHVVARNIEADIKKTIPSLTQIEDDVSKNVADMYEDNPYPRWKNYDQPPIIYPQPRARILVAGCGTSKWVVQTAVTFPHTHITAIDLSRSSIAYGVRGARQVGAFNTSFAQADILKLDQMTETFDLIESSGVLHHMKDPTAGFRQLIGRLRPGGRMFIALYSELGRKAIVDCRSMIAARGFSITPEGMRQFRANIMALPDDDPLRAIAMRRDFFSMSECRDLVFHIQETRYTIPELKSLLDGLELSFLGFRERKKPLQEEYLRQFPQDTRMTDLSCWDMFERQNPAIFHNMYQFVVCRKGEENTPSEGFKQIDDAKFFSIGRTI